MTIFAPYMYLWGLGNPSYKTSNLTQFQAIGGKAITLAFIIGNWDNTILDISNWYSEIKAFQKSGGTIILSFGGANGPYLEEFMTIDQQASAITKLLVDTGVRAIDFDIEGYPITNTIHNDNRNKVIKQLQVKFPDLYVSYTLAADLQGIPASGIALLQNAKQNGVKLNIVNVMAMDIQNLQGKTWGQDSLLIAETTVSQLTTLYPEKQKSDLYKMLGITVMIGKNDDGTIFTPTDAVQLVNYCKTNSIGLLSYWSMNRDQVGTGDLGTFSQANQSDYQYFNVFKNGITQTVPTVTTPVPTVTTPVWSSGVSYKPGNLVSYSGKVYKCLQAHTSIVSWEPDHTESLWSVQSATTTPATTTPVTPVTTTPITTPAITPSSMTNVQISGNTMADLSGTCVINGQTMHFKMSFSQ